MLGSVASDSLESSIVTSKRNVKADHTLASFDHFEVHGVNAGLLGRMIVEELHLLEEARLLVFVKAGGWSSGH